MAKIVLAAFGSLGDINPKIALGFELKRRGHDVSIAAMEFYRDTMASLGLGFHPMRPDLEPGDRELAADLMGPNGTERIIRDVILGTIREMYEDLVKAVDGADLFVTGEVVFAARSVAEKTGVPWISTSLAPISFFSAHDPSVPPTATWFRHLRPLGYGFHKAMFGLMRFTIRDWYEPYRQFRTELGLDPEHDPIFKGKFSKTLHLALFSKVLAKPRSDWPPATLQTGFCFYDGSEQTEAMPAGSSEFIDAGEPPIVFTLGSAAVLDPGDFFDESVAAAKILGRRAVLLYGPLNDPPKGLNADIRGFDFAPYSLVFPRAACVVHQGGVGTTGQALRAGVPQLIMPFGHDQPDNAERCRRAGVAEVIGRGEYNAKTAAALIGRLLDDKKYKARAFQTSRIVESERGTRTACDAIEDILRGRT